MPPDSTCRTHCRKGGNDGSADEPVGGGALIVNHETGKLPTGRSQKVYTDQAFLATLRFPVIATRDLFDWWRAHDWTAIQRAILA